MRFSAFLGSAIAAIGMGSVGSIGVPAVTLDAPIISIRPNRSPRGGKPPFRYRTGKAYPHSCDRQRARYARQMAAGQLNVEVMA